MIERDTGSEEAELFMQRVRESLESPQEPDLNDSSRFIPARAPEPLVDPNDDIHSVPRTLRGVEDVDVAVGDVDQTYVLKHSPVGDQTIGATWWDTIAEPSVGTAPVLYQVIAARYVEPAGTLVAVSGTPTADATLEPVWDWVRVSE